VDHLQQLQDRLEKIQQELKDTALVVVTKYVNFDKVLNCYNMGVRDFGESRLQDLQEKARLLAEKNIHDHRWHFIGHLQSNKINSLLKIKNLYLIHSVDSLKLLQELLKKSHLLEHPVGLLLEVNTSGEKEKSGFGDYLGLQETVEYFIQQKNSSWRFRGLMTMGRIRTDNFKEDARECFQKLKEYRQKLQEEFHLSDLKLSMGMSQDYSIALEEGADYVRLGSAIFED